MRTIARNRTLGPPSVYKSSPPVRIPLLGATNSHQPQFQPYRLALTEDETPRQILRSDRMRRRDDKLNDIEQFLADPMARKRLDPTRLQKMVRTASKFFLHEGRLWRRHPAC